MPSPLTPEGVARLDRLLAEQSRIHGPGSPIVAGLAKWRDEEGPPRPPSPPSLVITWTGKRVHDSADGVTTLCGRSVTKRPADRVTEPDCKRCYGSGDWGRSRT